MDNEEQSKPAHNPEEEPVKNPEVDEFFKRLNYDMRRPRPSPEAIAAALQAIQRLGLDSPDEEDLAAKTPAGAAPTGRDCHVCGRPHLEDSKFCGTCGVPLEPPAGESAAPTPAAKGKAPAPLNGQHHYHHHYHHHYFLAGQDAELQASGLAQRPASASGVAREVPRPRASLSGPALSRAEAAVRKMAQDWALACNNRHLDDLISLYSADALVLRSNVPPVRGIAALREFFFAGLDAGLGDVEMEPIRVEVLGDVAYEAGRCKMLVPVAVGKRREESGKYLLVFNKQTDGEWRIAADCWSSDLSLKAGAEPEAGTSLGPPSPLPRTPRRNA